MFFKVQVTTLLYKKWGKQEKKMNYDQNKVRVLNYLSGAAGISFVEFLDLQEKKVKILAYKTFKKRYEITG